MAKAIRICSVEGCDKPFIARGFCSKHYQRFKNHGDPRPEMAERGDPLRWAEEDALRHTGDDCLIWPFGRQAQGYGTLHIGPKSWLAHRYICQFVYGAPPSSKHEAAHSCGNGHLGCVNSRHLRWDTRRGNMADKVPHGTHQRGARNANAKLTEDQVREIRALAGSLSYVKIGARFGISHTIARAIVLRRRWGWLP